MARVGLSGLIGLRTLCALLGVMILMYGSPPPEPLAKLNGLFDFVSYWVNWLKQVLFFSVGPAIGFVLGMQKDAFSNTHGRTVEGRTLPDVARETLLMPLTILGWISFITIPINLSYRLARIPREHVRAAPRLAFEKLWGDPDDPVNAKGVKRFEQLARSARPMWFPPILAVLVFMVYNDYTVSRAYESLGFPYWRSLVIALIVLGFLDLQRWRWVNGEIEEQESPSEEEPEWRDG